MFFINQRIVFLLKRFYSSELNFFFKKEESGRGEGILGKIGIQSIKFLPINLDIWEII